MNGADPVRDEQGAATLLVVAMAAVVLVVGSAVAAGAGLVVAHRHAESAADLAALAAAGAAQRGGDPCAVASDVTARNGARLIGCRVRGPDVVVRAAVPGPEAAPWRVELVGTARAGPGG